PPADAPLFPYTTLFRSLSSALFVAFVLLAIAAPARDKKTFDPPSAYHANSYPARTYDAQNHITLAADPYDTPDKAGCERDVVLRDRKSTRLNSSHLVIS